MDNRNLQNNIVKMVRKAKIASRGLSLMANSDKNVALYKMARKLRKNKQYLMKENKKINF